MPLRHLPSFLGIFLLVLISSGCSTSPVSFEVPDDVVAARVGGGVVLTEDLDRTAQSKIQAFFQRNPTSELSLEDQAKARASALKALIDRELLSQEARLLGISIDPQLYQQQLDQLIQSAGGETQLNAIIQRSPLNRDQFIANLIEKDLLAQQLIARVVEPKIVVTDADLQEAYEAQKFQPEMVRASHVLQLVGPQATVEQEAQVRARMENLRAQIDEGTDFRAVAVEHSQCPSAQQGGDVGFFEYADMVPEFSATAFDMNVGAVSDVFRTKYGFHIVMKTDERQPRVAPFEELREQLAAEERLRRGEQITDELLNEIASRTEIRVLERGMQEVATQFPGASYEPRM